jgi:hypothetical protein
VTLNSARCIFAWIIAAVLLFRAGTALHDAFKARTWPRLNAIVTESDARWAEHRQPVRRSMWTYQLHLRYVYLVDGRKYIGTRESFSAWGPTENFNPFNSAIAGKYPVGAQVQAYYDPTDPSRSVLQKNPRPSAWIALVLGLFIAKLGIRYSRRVAEEKNPLAAAAAGLRSG